MKRLILLIFICIPSIVYGTDYYVTQSGAGNHNGLSLVNAWSWSEIDNNSDISGGDIIYFYGAFTIDLDSNGDLDISQSGSAAAGYIIFDASNSSGITVANTSAGTYIFTLENSDYIDLKDFTLRTGVNNTTGLRILRAWSSDHVKIHGFDADGNWGHGLWPLNRISNWEIYNNKFIDDGTTGWQSASSDAIGIKAADTVSIHNNVFQNWGHSAIGSTVTDVGDIITEIDIYYNYFTNPDNGAYGEYPYDIVVGGGSGTVTNTYFHHNMMEDIRSQIQVNSDNAYIYGNVLRRFQNCCNYATETGCDYGSSNPPCYSYTKIATGFAIGEGTHMYFFNNTMSDIAEAGITIRRVVDHLHIYNNILHDTAKTSNVNDSPAGSTPNGHDAAIVRPDPGGLTNWEIRHNIIDTDMSSSARNDFRFEDDGAQPHDPGAFKNVGEFEALHSEASNNLDIDPNFKSSTELWPDSASDPMIGTGAALTGSPYNTLPMYDQLIDPDTTDFTIFPPVVNTVTQSASWNIGAYAFNVDITPPAKPTGLVLVE